MRLNTWPAQKMSKISNLLTSCVLLMCSNCAAPPTANAGQYATSNCKPLLFGFSRKQQYINVRTFNLSFKLQMHQNPLTAGALPWTPLGSIPQPTKLLVSWGGEQPFPIPFPLSWSTSVLRPLQEKFLTMPMRSITLFNRRHEYIQGQGNSTRDGKWLQKTQVFKKR